MIRFPLALAGVLALFLPLVVEAKPRTPKQPIREAAVLPPAALAAREKVREMRAWNDAKKLPTKKGFFRALDEPVIVDITPDAEAVGNGAHAGGSFERDADGTRLWHTQLRIENADTFRVHLANVELSPGARFWIVGDHNQEHGPYDATSLTAEQEFWGPIVHGSKLRLQVEIDARAADYRAAFTIDGFVEGFAEDAISAAATNCTLDAPCVTSATLPTIDSYRKAVAKIEFVEFGWSYLCSGGLIADDRNSRIPYFLTANHCLSTQAAATSLVAMWDYAAAVCNGTPQVGQTQSRGAMLLSTDYSTDYTLLQLNSIPTDRTFLGWKETAPAAGAPLYRIAHPDGMSQKFSRSSASPTAPTCYELPRPYFLYSRPTEGAVLAGASGAPVVDAEGKIVGQLYGVCADDVFDDCNYASYDVVDGAFSATLDHLRMWLVSGCTYSISPSSFFVRGGGGSITVNVMAAQPTCRWAASWPMNYMSASGTLFTGSGSVKYDFGPNYSNAQRVTRLSVAGLPVTVTQPAFCSASPSFSGKAYGNGSVVDNVAIMSTSQCSWGARSNVPWITINQSTSTAGVQPMSPSTTPARGNGSLYFTINPNPDGTPRTGTITLFTADDTRTIMIGQAVPAPTVALHEPTTNTSGTTFHGSATGNLSSVIVTLSGATITSAWAEGRPTWSAGPFRLLPGRTTITAKATDVYGVTVTSSADVMVGVRPRSEPPVTSPPAPADAVARP